MKTILLFMALGLAAAGIFFLLSDENGSIVVEKIPFKTAQVIQGDLLVKISTTGVWNTISKWKSNRKPAASC